MEIHTLDLHFQQIPGTIAAYLVIGPGGPVLVETGPGSTLAALRAALARRGLAPADIRHVFVTHIHLDHAGAAGWWAQHGAQVYVHHFGARHLVDPARLLASAARIYGNQMETLWGEMVPAPAERVTPVHDNDTFHVAGLTFRALETPGHARHHHVWQLADVAFTGDAAGIRLAESPFIDLPAPPPEFDREAWLETVDRLAAANFATLYPTHFGRQPEVTRQLRGVRALLETAPDFIRAQQQAGTGRAEIVASYQEWVRQHARAAGLTEVDLRRYETANPLYMSVDGITRYWQKWDPPPTR